MCGWSGWAVYTAVKTRYQSRLVVYDVGRRRVMALMRGKEAHVVSDKVLQQYTGDYVQCIKPSLDYYGMRAITQHGWTDGWLRGDGGVWELVWEGKRVVVVDDVSLLRDGLPERMDVLVVYGDVADVGEWLADRVDCLVVCGGCSVEDKVVAQGVLLHDVRSEGAFELGW